MRPKWIAIQVIPNRRHQGPIQARIGPPILVLAIQVLVVRIGFLISVLQSHDLALERILVSTLGLILDPFRGLVQRRVLRFRILDAVRLRTLV